MGQSISKAARHGGSGKRLPRSSQAASSPPGGGGAMETREQMLRDEEEPREDAQLAANLRRFLHPQVHATVPATPAPAAANANVRALRQRQAMAANPNRVSSARITALLRELEAPGAAAEHVAAAYSLDTRTVRSLQAFLGAMPARK
ncbi:hypothetical protein GGI02_004930 [Coemansia sp. RSA 2322]|uniref:Uncharacterized protein n=1 Tax=Coemansia thaxteri TaxID=2663907 RepID=A0A9W8BF84_9FUNG|nr:hypothetical protein H4R26_001891 [Coemansia thaxteri]KAJ2464651.1 hypothetical protein GGI02_004930 [Coemansia sp. RSA 2322]KAJ2478524.1 hypothetical protein EV174_004291 [Coemansia sp. RSA 2320]